MHLLLLWLAVGVLGSVEAGGGGGGGGGGRSYQGGASTLGGAGRTVGTLC